MNDQIIRDIATEKTKCKLTKGVEAYEALTPFLLSLFFSRRELLRLAFLSALGVAAPQKNFGEQSPLKSKPSSVKFIPYADAQEILAALDEIVPAELKNIAPNSLLQKWGEWIAQQDATIRKRLAQGDVDTLINFLLFGNSFTQQPRLTVNNLAQLKQELLQTNSQSEVNTIFQTRIADLVRALQTPTTNERLLFLRRLVTQQGQNVNSVAGSAPLKEFLRTNFLRILSESESYTKTLATARLQGGANAELVERSTLYQTRGLSLDTSLKPNFALETSLQAMKARGLLAENKILRVAIIGPGLDFTDKADGYDFYPEQTIQPFALLDSCLKLQLATAENLRLTTMDISPRSIAHLQKAQARAKQGTPYVIQLPRENGNLWQPELSKYWKDFGSQIGKPIKPLAVPAGMKQVITRAVQIPAALLAKINPLDLNIVTQRMVLADNEKFDLIVATNILVYYDVLGQSLALKNIAQMLKPGGFLLSNNALLELPFIGMKSVDYLTVEYSAQNSDGDHIIWYQRQN